MNIFNVKNTAGFSIVLSLNNAGNTSIAASLCVTENTTLNHGGTLSTTDNMTLNSCLVSGLPGNWRYYISPDTYNHITLHGAMIDSLIVVLTDELTRPF